MIFSANLRGGLTALALAACMLQGCTSSSTGAEGGAGLTAKVDGKAWQADEIGATAMAVASVPGCLLVTGTQSAGGKSLSLTLTLYNVRGPGAYPLGVTLSADGGIGQVGEGTGSGGDALSWITEGTGLDGEMVITALDGGRIKGTFEYTAVPGTKNTSGTQRVVSEGRIDLPFQGSLKAVPDNAGGSLTATLGGRPYRAATLQAVAHDYLGGPGFTLSTLSAKHGFSIMLANVTGPGTYALDNKTPARNMTAGRSGPAGSACCWGSTGVNDEGTVTITSLDANRVRGTFRATLKPAPGKSEADLTVTGGEFDVGFATTTP